MLTVKNSRKRHAARFPASAISAGSTARAGTDNADLFPVIHTSLFPTFTLHKSVVPVLKHEEVVADCAHELIEVFSVHSYKCCLARVGRQVPVLMQLLAPLIESVIYFLRFVQFL